MPRILFAVVVALAFILTGCSATDDATTVETQPSVETEATGPSVEEFASVIAESRRDVDDWIDDWKEDSCSGMAVAGGDPRCGAWLISGGYVALTASLDLDSATKESTDVYIGDPPDEVRIIWKATADAADAANEAGEAIPDDCSADEECTRLVNEFDFAMDELQRKYDSWDPYM